MNSESTEIIDVTSESTVTENTVTEEATQSSENVGEKAQKLVFDEVDVDEIIDDTKFESYFEGKLLDYIGYNFLRGFLTAVTAGIAKPWADVIYYRYVYSHTIFDGKRLQFNGRGEDLFVERFKWIFFAIITLGIYIFWIPVKKRQWITSNLYFEDDEYRRGESFFTGKVLGMLGVNLLSIFLSAISLGLLIPYVVCYRRRWIVNHSIVSRKRLIFEGRAINLFGSYIKWVLLSIITLGIYSFWVPIKFYNWKVKNTFIRMRLE